MLGRGGYRRSLASRWPRRASRGRVRAPAARRLWVAGWLTRRRACGAQGGSPHGSGWLALHGGRSDPGSPPSHRVRRPARMPTRVCARAKKCEQRGVPHGGWRSPGLRPSIVVVAAVSRSRQALSRAGAGACALVGEAARPHEEGSAPARPQGRGVHTAAHGHKRVRLRCGCQSTATCPRLLHGRARKHTHSHTLAHSRTLTLARARMTLAGA